MERFLDYFVPEKYLLDLKIDKFEKTISGKVTIYGEVKSETVKFHAVNLSVTDVLIDGKKATFECENGVLTLFKVPRSVSCIEVGYNGSLNENMQGAYISTYEYDGRTETIVATQFESHYAREAFPCIDEPAAKAVFELNIESSDKDDLILTNVGLGEPTPRMSTYLLAWVIGKFHGKTVKNAHGVEITTYAALNQDVNSVDFANEIAAKSLEFYDDNFGVPYPLKKLDQVALPDFEAGAMENWGLVTYRESMLLAGASAALDTKKSVALTVAHELSHQWFGDLVTMEWWDDLWLNESFASVMEYYAVDAIHPEYKIFENFFGGDCLSALRRDCLSGVQAVHQEVHSPEEIATLFDPSIVYSKGARLMLMVIRAMGWDDFCRGIKEYFNEHQYGNTVGDDLWKALLPHAKFDVAEMMHSFIDRPGYPVITSDDDFVNIKQHRFLLDGKMAESDWLLPEISEDMSGHYILNLNVAEFEERLARFDKLGLEEKMRLLIDRDLLSKTELVESESLLPLLLKFKEEESPAVWTIIATVVSGLKIFFETGSEAEKCFKKYVKDLVKPGLEKIDITGRNTDDADKVRLRSILLALDFYASTDDDADKTNMRKLAKLYSDDYSKLDAEQRADILDAKLYLEPDMLSKYIDAYQKEADPEVKFELLFAMTLIHDTEKLHEVMKLLERTDIVKPQDQFHLFIYLYRNPVIKEEMFEWLTTHWEYVKSLAGDKSLDNYPRYTANSIRTEKEKLAYAQFFEPMSDDLALSRAIEVGKNEIDARLKLIESDKAAVERRLLHGD
ncbi:M1 family metallopeptidase [Candidatus Saccharibacteria bacterium]|nr:M1 family metallopeptidase [Candidatus Saccharibacteria bacterium]